MNGLGGDGATLRQFHVYFIGYHRTIDGMLHGDGCADQDGVFSVVNIHAAAWGLYPGIGRTPFDGDAAPVADGTAADQVVVKLNASGI